MILQFLREGYFPGTAGDLNPRMNQKVSLFKFEPLKHPKNMGYGSSISTGILYSKYNNIIITDSDNTYPAKILRNMVKSYQENIPCMVVASREGRNARIPLLRRPPKYFLRKLASYLCSYDIRDLNSGFISFQTNIV